MQFTFASLFSGIGGMDLGFDRAGFKHLFSIDFDEETCANHAIVTGLPAHRGDLATMTPSDLRALAPRRPDVLISSPPCVAFSGCLPAAQAATEEYQRISALALGGVEKALRAWEDQPPPLIVIENVPRIASRGRYWLDELARLLDSFGYRWIESSHDCGEIGALAQRRRRFLGVARHKSQVPEYLYQPHKHALRSVGDVFERLPVPLPGGNAGGPLHKLPRLSVANWIRLALIRAGHDWRDLPAEVRIASEPRAGVYGVQAWDAHSATVVGAARWDNGTYAVADPRSICSRREGSLGVTGWDEAAHAVIGCSRPQNTSLQVADPRLKDSSTRQNGGYGVNDWDGPAHAVIGTAKTAVAWSSVVDPRLGYQERSGALNVTPWASPTHTVIGEARSYNGANVADPRVPCVVGPELDFSDGRPCHLVIEAADGTWHRPMTTGELFALQGFDLFDDAGEPVVLSGRSEARWRKQIGNAVPPPAAQAIAEQCLITLRACAAGGLLLSSGDVWVRGRLEDDARW